MIYSKEIEKNTIFTKQRYYESGSRSARLLARRLHKQQADKTVYKIRDPVSKTTQYKQKEIQRTFENYYKLLYTQPQCEDECQINKLLNTLNLPTLSKEQNKLLTDTVTESELNSAISRLKANKSPGPDGLPSEWYKALRCELVPVRLRACNTTLENNVMPLSWNEAVISIIPKEGKDNLECGSYRPISV